MASGVLVALGAVLMAFCVWFAVFRLVPAYGKMVQTGDGAGFGLGLLMVLWWFVPALVALVAGGVLLCRAPGSVPAALSRLLAVAAWAGGVLALAWALPQVSVLLWGRCGWYVLRMVAAEITAHLLLLVLGLLLGWAGMRLWWRA
jgi:hypothetical protein